MPKTVSGKRCIEILCRSFGFFVVSQRGSHVKLRRMDGRVVLTTIVPLHAEIARGTIDGILALAGVSKEEFYERLLNG